MSEREFRIEVQGAGAITAIETPAEGKSAGWTFVYAPGAGSSVHDPFGAFACRELASRGVRCLRFQFPYQEARRKSPDKNVVLEATWRAIIDEVRDKNRLVIGGRSMGGRIGSQVVAQDANADAVALFAYPLHPPGRPEKARTAHLLAIRVPTLFCSGTGDSFGAPEELAEAAALVPKSTLHMLEGADHGFAVGRSTGRTRDDVWHEAVEAMCDWLATL